jgi:hypothetical protein
MQGLAFSKTPVGVTFELFQMKMLLSEGWIAMPIGVV